MNEHFRVSIRFKKYGNLDFRPVDVVELPIQMTFLGCTVLMQCLSSVYEC